MLRQDLRTAFRDAAGRMTSEPTDPIDEAARKLGAASRRPIRSSTSSRHAEAQFATVLLSGSFPWAPHMRLSPLAGSPV